MSQQYILVAAAKSDCPENEIPLVYNKIPLFTTNHHSQKAKYAHTAYTQKTGTKSCRPQPNNVHRENSYRKLHVPTKQVYFSSKLALESKATES